MGEDKGIMTKEYVEDIVQTYFKIENITHTLYIKAGIMMEKIYCYSWGVNEEPIYVLREYYTSDQKIAQFIILLWIIVFL